MQGTAGGCWGVAGSSPGGPGRGREVAGGSRQGPGRREWTAGRAGTVLAGARGPPDAARRLPDSAGDSPAGAGTLLSVSVWQIQLQTACAARSMRAGDPLLLIDRDRELRAGVMLATAMGGSLHLELFWVDRDPMSEGGVCHGFSTWRVKTISTHLTVAEKTWRETRRSTTTSSLFGPARKPGRRRGIAHAGTR